jgi:hypothetical protein
MAVFQRQKTGDLWEVDGTINTGTRMTQTERMNTDFFCFAEIRDFDLSK